MDIHHIVKFQRKKVKFRDGSRTAATCNMECFVITVNDRKPLTVISKPSILDVAAVLDPLLKFPFPIANLSIIIKQKQLSRGVL